jgi:hypothetical protein
MRTLVGTWKLVSATETTGKGEKKGLFGRNPIGFLTYTADGRMMAIITNGGRKPLSVNDFIAAPADERAEAFSTFAAYAGRYTRKGDTVIHHVEIASIQNFVGTDLVRTIAFQSGRLTLRTLSTTKGGAKVTAEVIWERIGEGISDAAH